MEQPHLPSPALQDRCRVHLLHRPPPSRPRLPSSPSVPALTRSLYLIYLLLGLPAPSLGPPLSLPESQVAQPSLQNTQPSHCSLSRLQDSESIVF